MSNETTATPSPHPLKAELKAGGFMVSGLALRLGVTYGWLVARLNGRVSMSPEAEALIRSAVGPRPEAPAQPAAPLS
jgi:hypothetical protein